MSDSDSDEERELRSRQVQKRRDMRSSSGASTSEAQAEAPVKKPSFLPAICFFEYFSSSHQQDLVASLVDPRG
jgi:hypothetical protein